MIMLFLHSKTQLDLQGGSDAEISGKLLAAGKGSLEPVYASMLSEFDVMVASVAKAIADANDLLEKTKVSRAESLII